MFDTHNIVFTCGLLLESKQQHSAAEFSKKISSHSSGSTAFILDETKQLPYVRIYETLLPQQNIGKAVKMLTDLSHQLIPLHIEWGMFEVSQSIVTVWVKNNPALDAFHKTVLIELQKVREGFHKEKYTQYLADGLFTPEEEKSIEKWGSPWAEPFIPHMVLAKALPAKKLAISELKLQWPYDRCQCPALFVGIRTHAQAFSQVHQLPMDHV